MSILFKSEVVILQNKHLHYLMLTIFTFYNQI